MQTVLDKDFIPAISYTKAFLEKADKPVSFALERDNGFTYRYDTRICSELKENEPYVERLIKMLLWAVGGYRIYTDNKEIAKYLTECYSNAGLRAFDKGFMERVYGGKFEVIYTQNVPQNAENSVHIGGNVKGRRVGFDAGGSDMKVSAVVDDEVIFSEEIVWLPKENSDPEYHYTNIRNAIAKGIEKLGGKVDSIGVSAAGIYINNRTSVASLFIKVPQDKFDERIKDIFINIGKEFKTPITVANDGDVAALAGATHLKKTGVLAVAMGTSLAAGYVDSGGKVTGWLNELAFAPVDYNTSSITDEWSGDYGVGCKYMSQDAVIKLAPKAGIALSDGLTKAEKLKEVQRLVTDGHEGAKQIFETIGAYFGYAIAYYAEFYDINYVQVLGRVVSGAGGDIIMENANKLLCNEFPRLAEKITLYIPDEFERRVVQSIAAASL